jgi:hypothetical protein
MSNRWITTESGDLLNLERVREVLMDSDEEEYSVVAYDSDPLHQENMWILFTTNSREEAMQYMAKLAGYLQAREINLTLEGGAHG